VRLVTVDDFSAELCAARTCAPPINYWLFVSLPNRRRRRMRRIEALIWRKGFGAMMNEKRLIRSLQDVLSACGGNVLEKSRSWQKSKRLY
jgi:hypothetical protein